MAEKLPVQLNMELNDKMKQAFAAFDAYNSQDPHQELVGGKAYPKEVIYAQRMSAQLEKFSPEAAEYVYLAARCQHIGRWEIERGTYPKDRKGYLQWRNTLKQHHARIAGEILTACGYDSDTIDIVKFLIEKKQLYTNPDTQLLEDTICLVFVEYYLADFAARHPDEKVVDILRKTLKKMSPRAIKEAGALPMTKKVKQLLGQALAS